MKRGRKSAAEHLSVVSFAKARPGPPLSLTEAQADAWRAITNRLPADWFPRETHPILTALCKHISTFELLSKAIDRYEPEWLDVDGGIERLMKLTQMRERESRGVLAASRALRLSKQAQIKPERAGRIVADAPDDARRPWDEAEWAVHE
jgi:hypothetical protein